jgi:hypothetical protein
VGVYTSSIGQQLGRLENGMKAFARRTMLDFGRRFRARMNRERIGGKGSVLKVRTGNLKRSLEYHLVQTSHGWKIDAKIGGGKAPYATDHEDFNRLAFQQTFRQESEKTLSELASGIEFFSRNPGAGASGGGGNVSEGNDEGGDPGRSLLLGELRDHFARKRANAKLARQKRWRSIRKGA